MPVSLTPIRLKWFEKKQQKLFNQMIISATKLASEWLNDGNYSQYLNKALTPQQKVYLNGLQFRNSEFYVHYERLISELHKVTHTKNKISAEDAFNIFKKSFKQDSKKNYLFNEYVLIDYFNALLKEKYVNNLSFTYINTILAEEQSPPATKCLFMINQEPFDTDNFKMLHEAMLTACENLGGQFLVCHYEEKRKQLEEIIKRFNSNCQQELWDQAFENVIEFVKMAALPRGGCVNFFKARYGETASVIAFYTVLNQNEFRPLTKLIKDEVSLVKEIREEPAPDASVCC